MKSAILYFLLAISSVKAAKFLAFLPFPIKSHQGQIQPLLRELAERGHQVISYTPFPLEKPPKNYHAIQLPDYREIAPPGTFTIDFTQEEFYKNSKSDIIPAINNLIFKHILVSFTEWALKLPEVQTLIKSNETFDAVIMETTFYQENFVGFGHRFNAHVIEYIPAGHILWSYWLHGIPIETNYMMDILIPVTDKMTFYQRTINTVLHWLTKFVFYHHFVPIYQKIMDDNMKYDGWESRPSMIDMVTNTSLVLVNSHSSFNYPHPMPPHCKEVGGLNMIRKAKSLPQDLQNFMDGAKDGVIYFTLGSHIKVSNALAGELTKNFLKVFTEVKQRVLWKWEGTFKSLPSNIKVSKWFPQQDILAHKNMKLFITHGGLLSIIEALHEGVPMVGIPIMADQFKNVEHVKKYQYGLQMYLDNITYDSLKWAVNEIIDNPKYAENARFRSKLFHDKPETALETAVYWTEYVIRHNGAHHLKPAISTMPWYQQAMIDVYATIAAIILIPLYIMYRIIKCLITCICCRKSSKTKYDKIKKNK